MVCNYKMRVHIYFDTWTWYCSNLHEVLSMLKLAFYHKWGDQKHDCGLGDH